MPLPVIRRNGCDYWRTWFIEECERSNLFGNEGDHPWFSGYSVGTRIYLIDEPYYRATRNHRICGPYEIIAMNDRLPNDAKVIHKKGNDIIVFKEAHPEKGPWEHRRHERIIATKNYPFDQKAKDYNYFPYRFGIRRALDFKKPCEIVRHQNNVNCWLC